MKTERGTINPISKAADIRVMPLEEQLRKAIQAEMDRRIHASLLQYDQWVKSGRNGEFRVSLPHDNDAARQLQQSIRKALDGAVSSARHSVQSAGASS